jgi:hypothetical protein
LIEESAMRTASIAVLVGVLATGQALAQTGPEQRAILRSFERAVATYAEQGECTGPVHGTAAPGPVIFTVPVSMVFRQLIAKGLGDPGAPTMSAPRRPPDPRLELCAPFPLADSRLLPDAVLDVLPALPPGVEYRFVGNDLVLRDLQLNVVVAVLHEAIRHTTALTQDG